MSLEIVRQSAPAGALRADRRLYLTADKARLVEHDDLAAAYLLAAEGAEISVEEVARLGLADDGGRVVQPGIGDAAVADTPPPPATVTDPGNTVPPAPAAAPSSNPPAAVSKPKNRAR